MKTKLNIVKEKKFTVNNEFVTYGFYYNPAHFKKVTNKWSFMNKPSGGLWSSPKNSQWGWKDWCLSEMFKEKSYFRVGFKFKLKKSAKIFVLNTISDYLELPEEYFIEQKYGYPGDPKSLNWEKLATEYDGFLLTETGLSETRDLGFGLSSDSTGRVGFNAWDCETLLVFSLDCISEVKSLRFFTDYCDVTRKGDREEDNN